MDGSNYLEPLYSDGASFLSYKGTKVHSEDSLGNQGKAHASVAQLQEFSRLFSLPDTHDEPTVVSIPLSHDYFAPVDSSSTFLPLAANAVLSSINEPMTTGAPRDPIPAIPASPTWPLLPRTRKPVIRPSIRFTAEALKRGVFCDTTFICKWGACSVRIQLAGLHKAEEMEFQRRVDAHIKKHAASSLVGAGAHSDSAQMCCWSDGQCRAIGAFRQAQSMERHIKTHIPWWVFCEHCDGVYSRMDHRENHLKNCDVFHERKTAGLVEGGEISGR